MILRHRRLCSFIALSVCLSACTSVELEDARSYGPTLADLPAQPIAAEPEPVPLTSLDQIEDSYLAALEVAQDPNVRHQILVRLADIEMARSETAQVDATEQRAFFTDAITMYEQLIAANAQREGPQAAANNERLMYQLSKAYALDGQIEESNAVLDNLVTDFPESAFAAEADFRRAELAFSNADYATAELLYAKVMAAGDDTPFYTNAVYMNGWSQFKQNDYRKSIRSFTEVLDRTLGDSDSFDGLSNSQTNLAKDTLRILSIVFSYLDGAETITEVYNSLGQRAYQYMLYANLGELYFEQDRFRDSADTYLHYVEEFPNTEQSPAFSVKAIEMYEQGGFPSLVLPAKEDFIRLYGAYSDYWKARDEEKRKALEPYLKTYLVELSSYYHAEGQALEQANTQYQQALAAGEKPKKQPEAPQPNFLRAAELYGEYTFTFPQDPTTPEMTFLQGEAFYSAQRLPEAVEKFDQVAYQYLDPKRGADAGYNSILILGELVTLTAGSEDAEVQQTHLRWQGQKIDSAINFSDYYSTDPRAVPVLTKAAQELFEQQELARAATIAQRLTEWQPPQSAELQKTAWLILAHARFDLEQYAEAEWAYRELLTRLPANDPQRAEITDRIAASMYRQAEFQLATGDRAGATVLLLSIRDVAPSSEIAATATYDAINHMIDMGDWQGAERELDYFKANYPNHELANTLTPKYALVYQESAQWGKAAGILSALALSGDPEAQRTSLYLAAELYERSGDLEQAIEHYRKYAHTYPEPFDIATEARYHMVLLYEQTNEPQKKDFWLRKLIEEDAKAGSESTLRSRSLATMAMAKFANDEFETFSAIRLTLPIKKSMKRKKEAMDSALAYYKDIMDSGIAEYVTEANHRIAEIYATLSRDLMDSQRPAGLDMLALEQYEILLEEQAYPFEEKAIGLYEANTARTQKGVYDDWVKASFADLAKILPARYGKQEVKVEVSDEIF